MMLRLLPLVLLTSLTFGAEVSGRITSAAGKPISNAKLVVFNELALSLIQTNHTDRNGNFHFCLPPGSYLIWVKRENYVIHYKRVVLPTGTFHLSVDWQLKESIGEKDREPNLKHILRHQDQRNHRSKS
ncbi:MAG: hypothetical protein CR997_07370 [Acidobacteria bacterium]|nr:MAG: hypothetical protein CR997_07370 [Acidobacteriota bacterium]